MRVINRWLVKALATVVVLGTVMGMASVPVLANGAAGESTDIMDVVTAKTTLEAKESPDENSATAKTYEAGAMIAVVAEVDDIWYEVIYQDNIYYVKKAETEEIATEANQEALDQEFAQEHLESKMMVEELERQKEEAGNTRIWIIIIVVLVVAIIAVGVYSQIMENKKND